MTITAHPHGTIVKGSSYLVHYTVYVAGEYIPVVGSEDVRLAATDNCLFIITGIYVYAQGNEDYDLVVAGLPLKF